MKIYDNNGYINMPYIITRPESFVFAIGGRGAGKTYGALKYVIENNIKFLYLRRRQSQIDIVASDDYSPFKAINTDCMTTLHAQRSTKYTYVIKDDAEKIYGYMAALSTFSNLRGFDGSDIKILIYDEFIPERHEAKIKDSATALFNTIETISRNRELKGQPPLKCLFISNSNDLGNELFLELNLVSLVEKMSASGQVCHVDKKRDLRIYNFDITPIGIKKKETALYKLTTGTSFENMALNNEYMGVEKSRIGSRKLNEYIPIVNLDGCTIYKHKANTEYYCCALENETVDSYTSGKIDKARLRAKYNSLLRSYIKNNIIFEKYIDELNFRKMFDI